MTHKLPPNLLALFAARPALRYLPASDHAAEERKTSNIGGVAQFLGALDEYDQILPYEATESWLQKKDRLKAEKKERVERAQKEGAERSESSSDAETMTLDCPMNSSWREVHLFEDVGLLTFLVAGVDDDPNVRGDAFKTLFIARLSYDTKEKDLEREFGRFGPIERVQSIFPFY